MRWRLISVFGNLRSYTSDRPAICKILSPGSIFVAGESPYANGNPPMPSVRFGNASDEFSFFNLAAIQPQFRVCPFKHATVKPGNPWTHAYCYLDANGIDRTHEGPTSLISPLFNPVAFAHIIYGDNPFLVFGDYDSAYDNDGALCLARKTSICAYDRVASIGVPNQTSRDCTYEAKVRDIHVDGDRIFALVNYVNSHPRAPLCQRYIKSEVREYALTGGGANIAFNQVGQAIAVSKNAVSLVPYSANSNKYLFIPCIGGVEHAGRPNNGAESSLSLLNVTSGVGAEAKPYIGGAASELRDLRGFAISSNGVAYILTGDFRRRGSFSWALYQDTAANLIDKASTTIPKTLRIKFAVDAEAHFWALGVCDDGAGAEYLAFAKGLITRLTDIVAYKELHFLKVGEAWSDANDAYNVIIAPDK
jgi:hypothetical protein